MIWSRPLVIPGEHEFQIFRAEVTARNFTKHVAEISGCEVASLEELIVLQSRPLSINLCRRTELPITNIAFACPSGCGCRFSHGPAKLGHRQDNHVVHSLAQVLIERRDSRTKLLQQVRQLTTAVALVDVSVPLAHVGERDLQPDVRLDQLRDRAQRVAERICRVDGAVLGFVLPGFTFFK